MGWQGGLRDDLDEEDELLSKLKTVKERVEYLMSISPNARNSDFYLIILYIRHFVPELAKYIGYVPYEIIKKYEGLFETIRRTRQKIQEDGRFLPTDPAVLKRRRLLASKFRQVIGKL